MVWQRLIQMLTAQSKSTANGNRAGVTGKRSTGNRRRLRMETLQKRELLATDLAAVSGIAFQDNNANGVQEVGEVALAGVQVTLFRDFNDNGVFNAGVDNQIGVPVTTGADGRYRFTNLDGDDNDGNPAVDALKTNSGRYIVRFSDAPGAPDLSGLILPGDIPVTVTADTGVRAQAVDEFITAQPGQPIVVTAVGSVASSSGDLGVNSGVLGRERDVLVTVDANTGLNNATFQIDVGNTLLDYSGGNNVTARILVQYDGLDTDGGGAALARNPVGLRAGAARGVPLNASAADNPATPNFNETDIADPAAGLLLRLSSDQASNDALEIRVFTDGDNWSSTVIDLPGGNILTDVFLPFASFTNRGANGGADFNNVGAIEMELLVGQVPVGLDFGASIAESQRSNEYIANAAIVQPVNLGNLVFNDANNNGTFDTGEVGIDGVQVILYADTNNNGTFDNGIDQQVGAPVATAGGGLYQFTGLIPGSYIVQIPQAQFNAGGPLANFQTSLVGTAAPDPDNDVNNDDNGNALATFGVVSSAITLVAGSEPTTDGDGANGNLTLDFGFAPLSDLVITKDSTPNPVNSGGTLTYTINVTNIGPGAAAGVVVTDQLPTGVTFLNGNVDGNAAAVTNNNGLITAALGAVAPGGAARVVTINVTVAPNADPQLINAATVTATPNNDRDPSNNTSANEQTTVNRVVDVGVTKTASANPVAGGRVTYTINVSNATGVGDARGVTVVDTLDPRLTLVPNSFNAGTSGVTVTPNGQQLTFNVGTLPAGVTRSFTFEASIASSAVGVEIPNRATIATTDTDNNAANNNSDRPITPGREYDLAITKTVDRTTAVPGQDTLVYTITVAHDTDSRSDAANVIVTDVLPAGLSGQVITASNGGVVNFNTTTRTATINFGALPIGATRTANITVNIDANAVNDPGTGRLTNPASVAATGAEITGGNSVANNTASAQTNLTPNFDVTVTKSTTQTNVGPGDTVTYTIGATKSGPSAATGVIVTDNVPTGLSFVNGTLNGQAATLVGGVVTFPALALANNTPVTGTLTFRVNDDAAAGAVQNTLSVLAPGESNTNNNTANATVTVVPRANLGVTKTVNEATTAAGRTLTYTITVSNAGPSTATGIQLVDTLPAGVTFTNGTGPGGVALTAPGGVVTVNQPTLANGANFQITINATVNANATGNLLNRAVVTSTSNDPVAGNNTADATSQVLVADSSVAGTIFVDANLNGLFDTGETTVAGVTVTLTGTDALGQTVNRNVTTTANGVYNFSTLFDGTYQVRRSAPPAGFFDAREQIGTGAGGAVVVNPTSDGFNNLVVDGNAVGFNLGLSNDNSKRRFLASSTNR